MADTINRTVEQIVFEGVDKVSAVGKQVQTSAKGMRQGLDAVNNALAAVGVTVGAGALIKLHLDALGAVSALGGLAQQSGSTVERLSAIEPIVRVNGKSMAELAGQLATTIKGLRQVGGDDGGRAALAFKQIGVETKDANGRMRDSATILVDLAKKLQDYHNPAERVQAVQDALGKGAEKWLPVLKDLAEAQGLQAKVTTKQADEAERAEKNMRRLTMAMEDGRRELVNQYTPAFNTFLDKLILASKVTGGVASGAAFMAMRPTNELTGNPNFNILDRVKEIDAKIAAHEQAIADSNASRMMAPAYAGGGQIGIPISGIGRAASGVSIGRLMHEREYLLGVQRQMALDSAGTGNEDQLDRRLQARGRTYISPDTSKEKKDKGQLTPAKIAEMQARSLEDFEGERTKVRGEMADHGATERKAAEARIKQIGDQFKTEQALLDEQHEAALKQVNQFNEQGYLDHQRANELRLFLEEDYAFKSEEIRRKNMTEQQKIAGMGYRQQAAVVTEELVNMTAGVAQHSKAMFEINKVAAIATIALKAPEAIASSYAFGAKFGGPYLGAAMGLVAGAAMAVQATAVAQAKFGGGSASPSLAGMTAAMPVSPVEPGRPQEQQSTIINLGGRGSVSADELDDLFETLNEGNTNGRRLVLSRGRRLG